MENNYLTHIADIIMGTFIDELDSFIRDELMDMNQVDLQPYFDEFIVEVAEEEGINSVEIVRCDMEEDGEDIIYYGEGVVNFEAAGKVYHDREYHVVESAEMELSFIFSFIKRDNQYSDIEFKAE